MSIEKYKKSTPDYTAAGTSRYSTDGQNLRFYYLKNVAMAEQNFEYCFSTNFNHTKYYENTYISLINDYNNTEDAKNAKTGITLDSTEVIGSDTYVNLNIDSITSEKLQGGTSFALLFNHGFGGNYEDLMICENIDYDKVVLSVIGYNLDNPNDSTEKGYTFNIYFNNGSSFDAPIINSGTPILVRLTKVNDKIVMRPLNFRTSDNVVPELQLYARWYLNPHPTDFNAEYPYLSTTGYSVTNNIITVSPRSIYGMYTTPFNNRAKRWEYRVYHSSYGDTYADYVSVGGTVDDFIKFLNSTGLRYCDTTTYTTYNDQLNNTYMGVMDENGVTDCNERIKGWANIDKSDLPNAHRTGYDWTSHDPTKPLPPSDEDDIDDMGLGVGRNYAGMVKYYRLSPAQLLLFSQEIQKSSVVPEGYDIMKNIIALKRFPVNLNNYAEFSEAELIKLGSVTVPLSASQLAWEKKNISLGTYTIQGYHGTKENPHFLDFSPYTTAEVFIPYCGFVTIPTDKIMYNEIEVRLLVDVKLGNCTGVVKCNGNIVGQKAGTLGADIPLVAVNMGVAMGAITQGLMDTTLGFVSAIPYAAAGNVAATFSGVLNGASALTQTIMSSKKNYTEVIGTTGGDIMFTMPDRCYIKITYPKKNLPSNYGKMVGYMCGKGGRLGDFSGFTICENVHVNVKATEEEKQMILEKLLTGVIMPYNG